MQIKAQDGTVYDIYKIGLSYKVIYCQDMKDKRKKHILGEYKTTKGAADIYLRIWNKKSGYYEMPME